MRGVIASDEGHVSVRTQEPERTAGRRIMKIIVVQYRRKKGG